MSLVPQYDSFFSIYLSVLLMLPCIILGFCGKRSRILNLITSGVLVYMLLGIFSLQAVEFTAFLMGEILLIYLFLHIWKKHQWKWAYYLFFGLTFLPILAVRCAGLNPTASSFIGFLGLSYMSFKIWQMMFDIHDGKITSIRLTDLLHFLIFFPSFSSGPIARYQSFLKESDTVPTSANYGEKYFLPGVRAVFQGFFYKFAVAFFINTYFMSRIPDQASFLNVIAYMYAYTLYLFFDFAGYSLMAVGMGRLMGIELPMNFNKPFLARNMKEFWSRWHMSLSTWFTDYVFGRFVLNTCRKGIFKSTKYAGRVASVVTMLLMGLWHGFTLHYIIYGLYEGVLLLITDIYVRSPLYRKNRKKAWFDSVSRVICFQFIAFGMLLFSGHFMNF